MIIVAHFVNFELSILDMNLIIDVGNTYVKLAVFKRHKLVLKEIVEEAKVVDTIKRTKRKHKSIKRAIVSSVGRLDKKTINYILLKINLNIWLQKMKIWINWCKEKLKDSDSQLF